MIKYIIGNIESSHISSKYIDDFINSKSPEKILNGFILLGYWANTYPLKYIYTRMLDILFIFNKNVDLRSVLTNENNINKFIKGIYLLFKAFPKQNEELQSFLNYIKSNIDNWISDNNLNITTKRMLDKLFYFVERVIINSDYLNKNTLYIHINN